MRTNISGLYTEPFYIITELNKNTQYFPGMGKIQIHEALLDLNPDGRLISEIHEYEDQLKNEVNKKGIIYQPTKFNAKIALKCHLIPFDIGHLKDCLVYNSLDYNNEHFYRLNLDLYQALADGSIDPESYLAENINWCKKFYAHYSTDTKYIFSTGTSGQKPYGKDILHGKDKLFIKHFSKELLEEVYEALTSTEEKQ